MCGKLSNLSNLDLRDIQSQSHTSPQLHLLEIKNTEIKKHLDPKNY